VAGDKPVRAAAGVRGAAVAVRDPSGSSARTSYPGGGGPRGGGHKPVESFCPGAHCSLLGEERGSAECDTPL